MSEAKKLSFEAALAKLEEIAEQLKKENITLEEAMSNYEAGIKYYEQCDERLNDAKQKIETYSK